MSMCLLLISVLTPLGIAFGLKMGVISRVNSWFKKQMGVGKSWILSLTLQLIGTSGSRDDCVVKHFAGSTCFRCVLMEL